MLKGIIIGVILTVAVIGIVFGLIPLIQQSAYTKLTLPIGTFVPYNLKEGSAYPEYNFRYGGVLGDNPNLLQVWPGSSQSPKEFSVVEGATYTAFAIEIKISEVHSDYIVILIKHLT
jgi:hypothetical protein